MSFDHERAYSNLNFQATNFQASFGPTHPRTAHPRSPQRPHSIIDSLMGSSHSSPVRSPEEDVQHFAKPQTPEEPMGMTPQRAPISLLPPLSPPTRHPATVSGAGGRSGGGDAFVDAPARPASPNYKEHEEKLRQVRKKLLNKGWFRGNSMSNPASPNPSTSGSTSSSSHPTSFQQQQQQHASHSHGHVHPSKSELNANALVAEIQRTTQVDMSALVADFKDLNRDIERLADKLGRHASKIKQWPPPNENGNGFVIAGDELDWRAHFESAEDFVFHGALAILSSNICSLLLEPFHPCMNTERNRQKIDAYNQRSHTELQRDLANWRSVTFSAYERTLNDYQRQTLLQTTLNTIARKIEDRFLVLPTTPGLDVPFAFPSPPGFASLPSVSPDANSTSDVESPLSPTTFPSIPTENIIELSQILARFYAWNASVKRDVLDYDLLPYNPQPGAVWDSGTMESFNNLKPSEMRALVERERQRNEVGEGGGTRIVGPMSIGLRARAAMGSEKEALSLPQVKARVLLELGLGLHPISNPGPASGNRNSNSNWNAMTPTFSIEAAADASLHSSGADAPTSASTPTSFHTPSSTTSKDPFHDPNLNMHTNQNPTSNGVHSDHNLTSSATQNDQPSSLLNSFFPSTASAGLVTQNLDDALDRPPPTSYLNPTPDFNAATNTNGGIITSPAGKIFSETRGGASASASLNANLGVGSNTNATPVGVRTRSNLDDEELASLRVASSVRGTPTQAPLRILPPIPVNVSSGVAAT